MKTNELVGAALDWAVAKCEGLLCFGYRSDGKRFAIEDSDGAIEGFMPSINWAQGGKIIERERISLWCDGTGDWEAKQYGKNEVWADTPLVAAMRCYVASKLGDEVQLPEELQ